MWIQLMSFTDLQEIGGGNRNWEERKSWRLGIKEARRLQNNDTPSDIYVQTRPGTNKLDRKRCSMGTVCFMFIWSR